MSCKYLQHEVSVKKTRKKKNGPRVTISSFFTIHSFFHSIFLNQQTPFFEDSKKRRKSQDETRKYAKQNFKIKAKVKIKVLEGREQLLNTKIKSQF